jgi:RyR domain
VSRYLPKPIDTLGIELSGDQRSLVEGLAANVHDVWAETRMADGWRYGLKRNDDLKTHPGLVPYQDLAESEKNYDRVMVEQVIKAAVALGYRIER